MGSYTIGLTENGHHLNTLLTLNSCLSSFYLHFIMGNQVGACERDELKQHKIRANCKY